LLADAFRAGLTDPSEFRRVYQAFAEPVLLFLTRRTHDPEVALDLAAETFAEAYISGRRFRGRDDRDLAAWLFAIARHQLAHYLRRGHAEARAVRRLGIRVPALSVDDLDQIHDRAGLRTLQPMIADALAQLSSEQRDAVELRVVRELSYPEIAQRLNITEQTARARVSRGLRALGELLEQTYGWEEVPLDARQG
jgi:RNA polymerase sigma factor (sigma-70 family)